MGALKTVLITGAGGYLGRYTVIEARRAGFAVRALVRRHESIDEAWHADAQITPVILDMGAADADFTAALSRIDAVIHIAACLNGNEAAHARDTIFATSQLYQAIAMRPVPVTLASSISVYQGCAGKIDEDSLVEPHPEARDAYTAAKMAQETMAHAAVGQGISACILRLGAVFGPHRLWNGHIGVKAGPVLFKLARGGEIPLIFAPHAASALVAAAQIPRPTAMIEILNIIDDDLPDARAYLGAIGRENRPRFTAPIPWQALIPIAWVARALRLPAPGLLRPATLAARMAPRCYLNTRAKAALGWNPATRLQTALDSEALK